MIMIEEMTEEILTKAKNGELRSLRFRAAQIYKRHFHGNQKLESEGWERAFLLEKYYQVIQSLKTRGILTKGIFEIDQVIFKDTIYGLDVPGLADVVLVPDYISIGGSFVKSPKEAEDIDIIFREEDKGRDESVELKVGRLIKERTKKEPHFIYSPYGPHSTYIPVFDLVLRPKNETKRTEVKEGEVKKQEQEEGMERMKYCICPECGYWEDIGEEACEEKTCSECGVAMVASDKKPDKKSKEQEVKKERGDEKREETQKELSEQERKECDLETEQIKENAKSVIYPHKFKAARFTHPNGHPRCVLCGQEERTGGICRKPIEKNDQEYYEGLNEWDEDLRTDNEAVISRLAKGSVVDFGCGPGRLMKALKDKGRKVLGIDINDKALEFCLKNGVEGWKVDLDRELPLPIDDGGFDNAVMVHMLEHLAYPEKTIAEAARVAKHCVVALSPLGKREDPTHKRLFMKLNDFKLLFPEKEQWKFETVEKTNSALAVLSKSVEKAEEEEEETVVLEKLSPMGSFTPPKPTMSGLTEAFDVGQLTNWLKGRRVVAEPKLNGFRFVIAKEGDRVKIMPESRQDRSAKYPSITEQVAKIPGDFLLDCSMGIERDGHPLPRVDLMTLMADKPELGEKDKIICTVFDLPYWNADLHDEPFLERRKKLEEFFKKHLKGSPNFDITEMAKVKDNNHLKTLFKKFSQYPQSEGVVIKDEDSKWSTDGSEEGWAKLKIEAELKVMVIERHTTSTAGTFNYTCGVLRGDSDFENVTKVGDMELVNLGKTFNTKVSAQPGDILTVHVEELIPREKRLDWLGANVVDVDKERKAPYFANQAVTIARNANVLQKKVPIIKAKDEEGTGGEFGNVDFEVGDTGSAVVQIHIMGIDEEEAQELKKESARVIAARSDLRKLGSVLKGIMGEKGAHIDIRFKRKGEKYWEGGEIMIGNLSGLSKLYDYKEGQSLRFAWKQSRVEEPKIEVIRGPMGWMEEGVRSVSLFEPGTVGATANKYAAMIRLDAIDWDAYLMDEHAKKFHITNSRHFDGNWLMAYVPVAEGKRVWMMRRLKADDHEEAKKRGKEGAWTDRHHKCAYCSEPAVKAYGWADGRAYIPVCEKHGAKARKQIEVDNKDHVSFTRPLPVKKLDLQEFRQEGVDEYMRAPARRWPQLIASLRYLGNAGYPALKEGKEWGDWKMDDVLKYFAKIVDVLRSKAFFPLQPPKIGDEAYKTSYWECYRKARPSMKTKPPSTAQAKLWEEKRRTILKAENAFTYAYRAVYGEPPPQPLMGRTKPSRPWRDLQVDEHLKDEWLEELNAIEGVEIQSTEEGQGLLKPAHIVFRFQDPEIDPRAEEVSKRLAKEKGDYSITDKGNDGRPRMVIASKVSYGDARWEEWWDAVSGKIKNAVKEIGKGTEINPIFKIIKVDVPEHIVGGVVYEGDADPDSQGDWARGKEIWEAMKRFMIKSGKIKVNHEGSVRQVPVVESYFVEQDHEKGGQKIKKGSWWLSVYLGDEKDIWKDVKEGRLTGFSIGGTAKRAK